MTLTVMSPLYRYDFQTCACKVEYNFLDGISKPLFSVAFLLDLGRLICL